MISQIEIEKADPLFLSVGRLEANKGMHILLKALSMADLPPSAKVVIAGTGSELGHLQNMAVRLGLGERVIFAGAVTEEQLAALYTVSDLFLNPTLYEGSSLVTLEAMSHGLPIIASNTGGLPDKVDPKLNGWLVTPNDPQSLGQAIRDAFHRRNEWRQMGEASAKLIDEKYSWEKVTPQFIALFQNPP
jgi:glycosyltransferase involved in cell wall biosynthesis